MFNPDLKILDCTIRDGGLMNNSNFPLETVRAVFEAVCQAGLDYVELGYRNSKEMFSPAEYGPWRFCDEKDLRAVVEGIDPGHTKIVIMQDAHKAVPEDILPGSESVVDMIRIATYCRDIDKAIILANNALDKGYECSINIMAISVEESSRLDEVLMMIEKQTQVDYVYLVDSFGAFDCDNVADLIGQFKRQLGNKGIGLHFHNNLQLAFANNWIGLKHGAMIVDGTLDGLGRAAGNCPTELLLNALKSEKYDILPLLEVIKQEIIPLKKEILWGYHIPYMLTGSKNLHPMDAMKWMNSADKDDIVKFYKEISGK
ncbi:MAG: nucleoid-structuring protein H-NS [bacterium]|nr:nucleoid-structuring protein H-NS [bacterium]